jgi:hypothetical protein
LNPERSPTARFYCATSMQENRLSATWREMLTDQTKQVTFLTLDPNFGVKTNYQLLT